MLSKKDRPAEKIGEENKFERQTNWFSFLVSGKGGSRHWETFINQ